MGDVWDYAYRHNLWSDEAWDSHINKISKDPPKRRWVPKKCKKIELTNEEKLILLEKFKVMFDE